MSDYRTWWRDPYKEGAILFPCLWKLVGSKEWDRVVHFNRYFSFDIRIADCILEQLWAIKEGMA